jgi:hypothetical protein
MGRARTSTLAVVLFAAVAASCSGGDGGSAPPAPGGTGGSPGGKGGSGGPSGTGGSASGSGGSASGSGGQTGGGSGGSTGTGGSTTDGGNPAPGSGGAPGTDGGAPATGDDWSWLSKPVPIVWITVNGATIAAPGLDKAQRTPGNLKVIYEHDGSPLTSIAGKTVGLDSAILIEHRGSSSYGFYAQKSFGFEFQDAMKQPAGQPLHDMPKNADWALVSCYSDKSCLRNAITYAIGREMGGQTRWAPRSRWAEVYIDGRYQGLYQLSEKPKDDKFRVNLPKPVVGAPPAEKGYMISADGDARSLSWKLLKPEDEFLDLKARAAPPAVNNRRWKFRAPSSETMTPADRQYVQTAFDKLITTLEGGGNWKAAIDAPSFVDYFLVSELTNNVDAYFKSWYFYKMPDAMGGQWSMGPIWDFDLGLGNVNYYFRYCTNITNLGNLAKQSPASAVDKDLPPPNYIMTILRDAEIKDSMRCRWNQLRQAGGPLDINAIETRLDSFVAHIKAAKTRDVAKWRNIPLHVWPNNYVGASWDDEVKYLKFWIRKRLAWVDTNLAGTCASAPMPPAVAPIAAPPSMTVDRSRQAYGGEGTLRHTDHVDIDGTTPPQWACPR